MSNIEFSRRYHAFDFIRTLAMLAGIPFHAALAYGLIDYNWVVMEGSGSFSMDFLGYFIRIFRMPLFFFMAGFFSHLVYLKRKEAFLSDRCKRVAIPLLFFSLLLLPFMKLLWVIGERTDLLFGWEIEKLYNYVKDFYWRASDESYARFPINFGHLWFLLYLLVLSFTTSFFVRFSLSQVTIKFLKKTYFIFPVFLTFLTLLLMKEIWVDKPFIWYPRISLIFYYGVFFFYGWLGFYFKIFDSIKLISLNKWFVIFSLALMTSMTRSYIEAGGMNYLHVDPILLKLWMSVATWLLLFSSIGVVNIFFKKGHKLISYLGDASYFLYIIHLPIIVMIQLLISSYKWHWGLKFFLVNTLTIVIIIPIYHYFIRNKFVDRMLKGQLRPRP